MCGVFGFITRTGRGPDLGRLRRLAIQTEQRGTHAFGLAWVNQTTIDMFKRPGPATANLDDIDVCKNATAVIGHCRWATHGNSRDNRNNHPHQAGTGWMVHNGVVRNHEALIDEFHLHPQTECDSEVLGLLIAKLSGKIGQRAARSARAAQGPLVILGVWQNPTRLLVVRNGNPLSFSNTPDGVYFASLPYDLPGKAHTLKDRYVGVLSYQDGVLVHENFSGDLMANKAACGKQSTITTGNSWGGDSGYEVIHHSASSLAPNGKKMSKKSAKSCKSRPRKQLRYEKKVNKDANRP